MATIVKRGKNFYVVFRYDDANGNSQQKWESFKTKKEAQKRKSEVEHEIDTGTFIPPASIKIKDFLIDFVDMYGKRKWGLSMYTSNSGLIRNYINPILGEVNVQDVDARVVDKFIATLQKTKAVDCNGRRAKTEFVTPCTIEKICKLMRCAFGQEVYAHILDEDRKVNAQRFEPGFYSRADLRGLEQSFRTQTVQQPVWISCSCWFSCSKIRHCWHF